VNLTETPDWVEGTTVKGMPIGDPFQVPEPKSGWSGELAPIAATIVCEFDATGRFVTGVFHTFDAGSTVHPAMPGAGTPAELALRPDTAPLVDPSASTHPLANSVTPRSAFKNRGGAQADMAGLLKNEMHERAAS
jgi:hypothetical protein